MTRQNDLDVDRRETPVRQRPSQAQRRYLARGLGQPGGKLPLHDPFGQRFPDKVIESCLKAGWAEPWLRNPIKPDWLVCRLTEAGRRAVTANDMGEGIPA